MKNEISKGSIKKNILIQAFPLTMLIAALTFLYGSGGTPLFSIARGRGDEDQAEKRCRSIFWDSFSWPGRMPDRRPSLR